MIRFEVSETDWLTSKRYWSGLQKHFVLPDDRKKADFLDHTIFGSKRKDIGTTTVPSLSTMSEIMNEIDAELGNDDKKTTEEFDETTQTNQTLVELLEYLFFVCIV